jgi:hypothetical protein
VLANAPGADQRADKAAVDIGRLKAGIEALGAAVTVTTMGISQSIPS